MCPLIYQRSIISFETLWCHLITMSLVQLQFILGFGHLFILLYFTFFPLVLFHHKFKTGTVSVSLPSGCLKQTSSLISCMLYIKSHQINHEVINHEVFYVSYKWKGGKVDFDGERKDKRWKRGYVEYSIHYVKMMFLSVFSAFLLDFIRKLSRRYACNLMRVNKGDAMNELYHYGYLLIIYPLEKSK